MRDNLPLSSRHLVEPISLQEILRKKPCHGVCALPDVGIVDMTSSFLPFSVMSSDLPCACIVHSCPIKIPNEGPRSVHVDLLAVYRL